MEWNQIELNQWFVLPEWTRESSYRATWLSIENANTVNELLIKLSTNNCMNNNGQMRTIVRAVTLFLFYLKYPLWWIKSSSIILTWFYWQMNCQLKHFICDTWLNNYLCACIWNLIFILQLNSMSSFLYLSLVTYPFNQRMCSFVMLAKEE